MTDLYDEDDDFGTEADEGFEQESTDPDIAYARVPRQQVRRLERKAKEAGKHEARAAAAERELAFYRAGLNPSDPRMKWFSKGYDGPLDVDAITEAAVEAGIIEPNRAAASDDESRAHQAAASLSGGSTGNTTADNEQAYLHELASARSPDEATQVMLKYGKPVSSFAE